MAPLDDYDEQHAGELLPSLWAFLERNARWESAAKELTVHRHTLRYRMRKVEELTGRNLSSARDRMEFFLALRARAMLVPGDGLGRGPARRAFGPTVQATRPVGAVRSLPKSAPKE